MVRLFCVCSVIAVALLGGVAACGGSGGDGDRDPDPTPTPLTTLRGEYRLLMLSATSGPDPTEEARAASIVGTATSDGRGDLEITTETYTTDPGHMIPLPGPNTETLTYTESTSRALTLSIDVSGTDLIVASGTVSADGQVAVLAFSAEGRDPGLMVLTRSVTNTTADDFAGKYLSLTWAVTYDATSRGTAVGAATFETPSTCFDTITHSNTDGVAWSGSTNLTGSWYWDTGGGFDVSYSGSVYDFLGGLGCTDPVILCGGSFTTGDGPGIRTYVVGGGGSRTLAEFDGSYYAAGLMWRPSDGHYVGFWGSLSPNGTGQVSRSFRTNDEGSIGLAFPATSTYAWSGALLTVGLGPYGHCIGALSPTGHVAFLGGGTNAGDPVSVVVVVRR